MNIASIIKVGAFMAWLGFFALLVLMLTRSSRKQPVRGISSAVVVVLVGAILLSVAGAGLVYVEATQRGVVKTIGSGGVRSEALSPGLHWILPFVEQMVPYSISRQTYTMSVAPQEGQISGDDSIRARTKDGQEVFIDASVIYSVDPAKVVQLHIDWQNRYEEGVVRAISRGTIRDVASQYGVEEIVSSKRTELEQKITEGLRAKLAENDLLLVDFVLRDIHFSEEYAAAVEQKQIAEQQVQQAKFVVESKKQEAEQVRQTAQGAADAAVISAKGAAESRLIQAQAEAQANQLLSQSLTPQLIQYQYILRLAPGVQTIFIPSDQQFILPLPGTALP
ncbi:MAG TPA: prohibitin family protein [Anaerolineales bacterium]